MYFANGFNNKFSQNFISDSDFWKKNQQKMFYLNNFDNVINIIFKNVLCSMMNICQD
jgi:hypothetical protein